MGSCDGRVVECLTGAMLASRRCDDRSPLTSRLRGVSRRGSLVREGHQRLPRSQRDRQDARHEGPVRDGAGGGGREVAEQPGREAAREARARVPPRRPLHRTARSPPEGATRRARRAVERQEGDRPLHLLQDLRRHEGDADLEQGTDRGVPPIARDPRDVRGLHRHLPGSRALLRRDLLRPRGRARWGSPPRNQARSDRCDLASHGAGVERLRRPRRTARLPARRGRHDARGPPRLVSEGMRKISRWRSQRRYATRSLG